MTAEVLIGYKCLLCAREQEKPGLCEACGSVSLFRVFGPPVAPFAAIEPRPVGIQQPLLVTTKYCIGCGLPVARARRCRRCYLRHRYATDPEIRARQLRYQAAWRERQKGQVRP